MARPNPNPNPTPTPNPNLRVGDLSDELSHPAVLVPGKGAGSAEGKAKG